MIVICCAKSVIQFNFLISINFNSRSKSMVFFFFVLSFENIDCNFCRFHANFSGVSGKKNSAWISLHTLRIGRDREWERKKKKMNRKIHNLTIGDIWNNVILVFDCGVRRFQIECVRMLCSLYGNFEKFVLKWFSLGRSVLRSVLFMSDKLIHTFVHVCVRACAKTVTSKITDDAKLQ